MKRKKEKSCACERMFGWDGNEILFRLKRYFRRLKNIIFLCEKKRMTTGGKASNDENEKKELMVMVMHG